MLLRSTTQGRHRTPASCRPGTRQPTPQNSRIAVQYRYTASTAAVKREEANAKASAFFPPPSHSTPPQPFGSKVTSATDTLQKLAEPSPRVLTDLYGRFHNYLRISLTERCNLRCKYCMPEEGVDLSANDKLLTTPELIHITKLFVSEGVDKVRLTGGEPSIRKDIEDVVAQLGAIPGLKTIAMTTNGLVLARKLEKLKQGGLTHLNISLDTLQEHKFAFVTRREGFHLVMKSINLALDLGYNPLKINCVVMRGVNDDELIDFVAWTKDKPIEVRFIEYMPFEGNHWNDKKFMPYKEMVDRIRTKLPLVRLPDAPNNTSRTYGVEGWQGKVGFITSMSEHFCSSCNRIRLMADGSLKMCLFGSNEVSLRDMLRQGKSEEDLKEIIQAAVRSKKPSHDGMYEIEKNKLLNRPMIKIGG